MTLHSIIIFSIALWTSVNASSDIGTNAETQMGSFCRRFEHRTTVLNNKLYIDGGFVNANPLEVDGINYTSNKITVNQRNKQVSDLSCRSCLFILRSPHHRERHAKYDHRTFKELDHTCACRRHAVG